MTLLTRAHWAGIFILETGSSISCSNAADYRNGAKAGSIIIFGSHLQQIDTVAQSIVNDNGINISNIICHYGGTGDVNCIDGISGTAAPTNTGTNLSLCPDIVTTTSHVDGDSAAPTVDIVATYN